MKTHARFPAVTRWTRIRHADDPDHPRVRKALEELLQLYLDPVYAFIRQSGYSREDAEDLVQGFYLDVLEHRTLARAREGKGRFRTFLITCLKQFLTDEYRRNTALKRGGKEKPISLDAMTAEERFVAEPADHLTPDKLLTRKMTLQIIESIVQELRAEHAAEGKTALFDALYAHVSGDDSAEPYPALSARLGPTVSDLKTKTFRLRKRFQSLFQERLEELCDSDDEAKAEAIAMEDSLQ